jgi:putative oxidoreductase
MAAAQGLLALRLLVAGLIAVHGWARLLAGGVMPFGGFLDGVGLPYGVALAAAITAIEIAATPLLAWGRWTAPLALLFAAIYAVGILLVHAPAGWFVVGLGRNGAEYSVLLIATLLAIAWSHR